MLIEKLEWRSIFLFTLFTFIFIFFIYVYVLCLEINFKMCALHVKLLYKKDHFTF